MKRLLIILFGSILTILFFSCNPGDDRQSIPEESVTSLATPAASSALPTATPAQTAFLEINSALTFLNNPVVISKDDRTATTTKSPELLKPGEIYVGGTLNDTKNKYDLLILDKEQSEKILTADDITQISYRQSECLPIMLRWDDVSVLDMQRYYKGIEGRGCKAYYYYLDNSTVIIVNDSIRAENANKQYEKAWILVVPNEDGDFASWIPPKGTFTDRDDVDPTLYEPYYDHIRDYFLSDPELQQRAGLLSPVYENYMVDYKEWMKWREEHPDFYETWKQLSYPEKMVNDDYSDFGKFRVDFIDWCEALRNVDESSVTEEQAEAGNLPGVYYQIKQYGIPKEEMLEYVKWMKWSGNYHTLVLSEADVEVLYSGSEEDIRRSFLAQNAVYFEGRIYRWYDIKNWVPAYDVARMYTRELFYDLFLNSDSAGLELDHTYPEERAEGRVDRLKGALDEYDNISKADSGNLNIESAERVLSGFMELYKETKYTSDVLAGEPASKYDSKFFLQDERCKSLHLSNKCFSEIREEMYNIFTPDLCNRLNADGDGYYTVFYSSQFSFLMWEGFINQFLVSDLPEYYDGSIELFNENYALKDHISIESSDEEFATAVITAKNRAETGEKTYSVEFSKVGGRWLISGGTIIEIIAPPEQILSNISKG